MYAKIKKAIKSPRKAISFLHIRGINAINKRLIWKSNKVLFPPEIHIIVNNSCNYKCKTCDIGIRNTLRDTPLQDSPFFKNLHSDSRVLSLEDFKKIAKEASKHGSSISFKGTEPTLVRNISEYISILTKHNLPSSITTNGYLLKMHAEDLVKSGLRGLQVSLDGPPEVNDLQRGMEGGCEKSLEGIKAILKAKNESKKNYPFITVNVTVSDFNYDKLVETMDFFKKQKGIDHVVFQHYNWISKELEEYHNKYFGKDYRAGMTCISEASDPRRIKSNILKSEIYLVKQKESQGEYPFSISFKPDFKNDEVDNYYNDELSFAKPKTFCHFTYQAVTITSSGDVVPHMRCYEMKLGNIKEKNLSEIWNGESYKKFREVLRKNGGSLPACAKCCGIFY